MSHPLPAIMLFLLVAALVCMHHGAAGKKANPNSINMKIINYAGSPVELFWINTFDKSKSQDGELNLVRQTTAPLRNSSDTAINSYNTHEFLVRFHKHQSGVETRFTKGPREETITIYHSEEEGLYVKQITKFDEMVDTISKASKACEETEEGGVAFSSCVADALLEDVQKITDSKSTILKYRDVISDKLRNYTCADPELQTSEPTSSEVLQVSGKNVQLHSLLDTSHAKIWTATNFATDKECEMLMDHARPRLKRATTAKADGSSEVSQSRKAWQATYNIHSTNDKLYPLYKRILEVTNKHAGYGLSPAGQEGLTVIQYNPDDEYTPHCDGDCSGSFHNPAGRVATAIVYCEVPEVGGATTFSKADVYVKPEKYSATFFSYKGPDGRMDEGFTEHSGCPVVKGEKWIATFWMREGVTSKLPASMFDPSGLRLEADSAYAADEL
jgi:hypothetical protein